MEEIYLKYLGLIKQAKLEHPVKWEAVVDTLENELNKDLAHLRWQYAEALKLLKDALENEQEDQEPVEPDLGRGSAGR